jgi:hypothetical protein
MAGGDAQKLNSGTDKKGQQEQKKIKPLAVLLRGSHNNNNPKWVSY